MVEELQSSEEAAWAIDEVEKIVVETLDQPFLKESYSEEQVAHWINTICEGVVKKLNDTKKPFKYIVSCVIMQRNGAGIHTATSSYWDSVNDGCLTYIWPKEKSKDQVNKSLYCIVTVFGLEF